MMVEERSGPPCRTSARSPVGEVTLISVSQPSMTSMPTKRRPRSSSAGFSRAQISFSRGVSSVAAGHAAAHHVGADVVLRGHAIDRAERLAFDEQDALVALHDLRQEALHDPGLAEGRGEEVIERAEIRIARRDLEDARAAMPIERLHHDLPVPGAEALDRRLVAGDERRRHEVEKLGDEELFGRVAHMRGVVDDENPRRDALEKMRGGDVGEIEGRVLTQQHDVDLREIELARLAEAVIGPRLVAHRDLLRESLGPAVLEREPVGRVEPEPVPAARRLEHHGEGRVAGKVDLFQRVHLDRDLEHP